MSWTCEKCGTTHDSAAQREDCAKAQRKLTMWAIGIMLAIGVSISVPVFLWNQYAYGDWKCAVMHCVKVVK
jgi:hypothetical protein